MAIWPTQVEEYPEGEVDSARAFHTAGSAVTTAGVTTGKPQDRR